MKNMRNNKGKDHRYSLTEKLDALELNDNGMKLIDIEIAKGIPAKTLGRWKRQRKVLQARKDNIDGTTNKDTIVQDSTLKDKDVLHTTNMDTKGHKETLKDKVAPTNKDKPDIKPDTQDTNKNHTENNDHSNNDQLQNEAYNEGYIDGGNDKVDEVASQVENAYKGFVDPTELKQALNEAKNGLARVNLPIGRKDPAPPSKTPEMPLPEPDEPEIIAGLTKWDLGALAAVGGLGLAGWLVTKNKTGKNDDSNW